MVAPPINNRCPCFVCVFASLCVFMCVCLERGLGVETAKNLVLAGPGAVTLCDDELVSLPDLGANFFLEEVDVGKPRAR